ncbi:MAG: 2-isopropylmalate synthase [Chloroflexi bacterium]|nr:2-isopropylmalate synthase [Chloroflexota bacterium]
MTDRIRFFDTTLRDGEQAPGATLTLQEKVEIARALCLLGVDVIEAGFPQTSQGDFDAVRAVCTAVTGRQVAALSGFKLEQIDRTWEAIREAEAPLLHIVLSTSDIHLHDYLGISREQAIELCRTAVRHARKYTPFIEFSAMDAARSDRDFVCRIFETAIAEGALVVNYPDTVGYAQPRDFGAAVRYVKEHVPGIEKAILSVHCHDDLGLATANSLAAIENGAAQVEGTINGVGERAGNTALEEVIMALVTRKDYFKKDVSHIDTRQVARVSRLVSRSTGCVVPPNKAVVGANAFAHSSGLHQAGMMRNPLTFEIMQPEMVGQGDSQIILGKTSGRHAFSEHLRKIGYHLSDTQLSSAFLRFKEIADKKKEILDADLEALVEAEFRQKVQHFTLEHVQVTCGDHAVPTATVRLSTQSGSELQEAATGTGPVDAIYRAINRMVNISNRLEEYTVQSVTQGLDAQADVRIRIEVDEQIYVGRAASTDIIVASAQALVDALNRCVESRSRRPAEASA